MKSNCQSKPTTDIEFRSCHTSHCPGDTSSPEELQPQSCGLDSLGQASAIRSAGEKLNVALVGVGKGGIGGVLNLPRVARENVVALCDIDEAVCRAEFREIPQGAPLD